MKVVILAGGFGTRISEESQNKPKPMIEIGGKPILWHIMKIYSFYGFNEFIICAGYRQECIKEWFANYYIYNSDITFDFTKRSDKVIVHDEHSEPWKVTVVDTGLGTMTGGRLKRIQEYVKNDEIFMVTYGDGVADVNISQLLKFHLDHGKFATLTAVLPEGRFGTMDIENNSIKSFREKSRNDVGWINGGFMVLNTKVLNYIENDRITFEKEPLEKLAVTGQLMSYKHNGFWQCMDTLRDKKRLEDYWESGLAPWKVWN